MNFSDNMNQPGQGRNFSSLALVALAHVLVFGLIAHSMNTRLFIKPVVPPITTVALDTLKEPPPPPPVKPQLAVNDLAPPPVYVPAPEIVLDTPPPPNNVRSTEIKEEAHKQVTPEKTIAAETTPPASVKAPLKIAAVVDAKACDKPEYPKNAMRNNESGTVSLAMLIGVDGKVVQSRVEKSSGSRELDKAAQQGLSLCRFKPGTVDGVPEQSWTKMDYVWTID